MSDFFEFQNRFQFRPDYTGRVGVERECFLVRGGVIAPIAHLIVPTLADPVRFGFELSACQLETRTVPSPLGALRRDLVLIEKKVIQAEQELAFGRLHYEVAPEDMPLDIYLDPSGRYQRIAETLPGEVLSAACRVVGTHVHIGMPNHEVALKVYNGVLEMVDELCAMGDGSCGERLRLYRLMAPKWRPQPYESWSEFFETAKQEGFDDDPRRCWALMRISSHGTIEFRMFGATDSLDTVMGWAEACHRLCMQAMT